MSALSLKLAEMPLLNHLQLGGSVTDLVGQGLAMRFARKAMADSKIRKICDQNDFDIEDICLIYVIMIEALMPNPCILAGGHPILVATLFFIEPFRLEGMFSQVHRDLRGKVGLERREFIAQAFSESAQQCWSAHKAARGEAEFTIIDAGGRKSTPGCTGVLGLALLGFGTLSAGAASVLAALFGGYR
jgi:hypothetical protein